MSTIIKLEEVYKVFNKGKINECIALDQVSLRINKGDYITVWGGNGAGKTSLLDIIAKGQLSSGHIFLNGRDITHLPEHKRSYFLSRVTQNPFDMIAESLTLEEHFAVALCRKKRRSFRKGISAKLKKFIKEQLAGIGLGLESRLNENISNFSGGERQAVTLLMATIAKPEILLLDEHTAALDLEKTKLIEALTDKLIRDNGITALWVTHKKEQAARFGNRILFMQKGKIARDLSYGERAAIPPEELIDILEKFQMTTGTSRSGYLSKPGNQGA